MNKLQLPNVTLLGIDCVDTSRLQEAMDISQSNISFGSSKLLTDLPVDDKRRVEIPHIGSTEEYSSFCIKDLYKYVETDFVLIIQYDGFVLNADSWDPEFLKYDYIGSPWLVTDILITKYGFPQNLRGSLIVGNGGFSLRSKKFLEVSSLLANEGRLAKLHPEDNAMCVFHRSLFEDKGIKFATPEVARKFSIEGKQGPLYDKQFGFHGFKWTDIDAWISKHPEYPIAQINSKKLNMRGTIFPS